MLQVHCGLAVHLFHSRTQVPETALIWDIPGLLTERRKKVEDHVMALKLICMKVDALLPLAKANDMANRDVIGSGDVYFLHKRQSVLISTLQPIRL